MVSQLTWFDNSGITRSSMFIFWLYFLLYLRQGQRWGSGGRGEVAGYTLGHFPLAPLPTLQFAFLGQLSVTISQVVTFWLQNVCYFSLTLLFSLSL